MSRTPQQIAFLEANRDRIEARRTFQFDFRSVTVRAIEGSTPWPDGTHIWIPALNVIQAEGIKASGVMDAHPARYRLGRVTPDLGLAVLSDESEWRDRRLTQRLVLFLDGVAVGPAVHIHSGLIADIRRRDSVSSGYLEVRVEGPFKDRNAALLGKYTDRDQQMRSPGDRGCEYVALYESSGAEFVGWLQG